MKILLLHSNYLKFKAREKAIELAEELDNGEKRIKECLVVFNALEKGDSKDLDSVVSQAVEEIKGVAKQVSPERIVIYPWVHLTSNPGNPKDALKAQKKLEESIKGYEVIRAPFGWYKELKIHVKGHPLAELSREIKPGEEKKTREDVKEEVESQYLILTQDGKEIKLDLKKGKLDKLDEFPLLKKYVLSDEIESAASKEPPSIDKMQQLELVDYEPASDPGNFRFYPNGKLVFDLLKEWTDEIALERLNSMEIETPILYDWGNKAIREQGGSFHERHYQVQVPRKDKELVLRFAGDFGLFQIMKDAVISWRNLPMRMYEFSKSFRYEKRGELTGLRRLRAFHMPDIHSFCKDIENGWEEYQKIYKEFDDLAKGTKADYCIVFRITEDFYNKYKQKIVDLIQYSDKPAFVEILSERTHYWAVKHEFQGIDSVGGSFQLSTVQLDVEDAERYGIVYSTKENEEKGCIICHSSIGSIERWIYVVLENAFKEENPTLPLWLSPIQVRLCPLSDKFIPYSEEVAEKLEEHNIRVDIDDRDETVSKKIRSSEMKWVPYTLVIGENEVKGDKFNVRRRSTGEEEKMELEELIKEIKGKVEGYPFKSLSVPKKLKKRPIFVG